MMTVFQFFSGVLLDPGLDLNMKDGLTEHVKVNMTNKNGLPWFKLTHLLFYVFDLAWTINTE